MLNERGKCDSSSTFGEFLFNLEVFKSSPRLIVNMFPHVKPIPAGTAHKQHGAHKTKILAPLFLGAFPVLCHKTRTLASSACPCPTYHGFGLR